MGKVFEAEVQKGKQKRSVCTRAARVADARAAAEERSELIFRRRVCAATPAVAAVAAVVAVIGVICVH